MEDSNDLETDGKSDSKDYLHRDDVRAIVIILYNVLY